MDQSDHTERKFQEKLPCLSDKEGAYRAVQGISSCSLLNIYELLLKKIRKALQISVEMFFAPSLSDKHGNFSWNFLSVHVTKFLLNIFLVDKIYL